jgi:acyl-CoA synthetase (NDP forming)
VTVDTDRIRGIVARAREQGRTVLLETEGLMVLEALGLSAPAYLFVRSSAEAGKADLSRLCGERVVVKVISPRILHKSDVGGVAAVARDAGAVTTAISDMETRLGSQEIVGFTINEFVTYDRSLGSELLLGLRWTEDFGPVVTLGAGGIYTEFLAASFRPGREIAIVSPELTGEAGVAGAIGGIAVTTLVTGRLRGQPPRLPLERLVASVETFMALGAACVPGDISECEINPLVITGGNLVALDILIKLGTGEAPRPAARPIFKLKHLLEPRSAAIIGVSEKLNPGHIILNNLIREGFDRQRIYVVKPGSDRIEGCRCVPDIGSLPEKVDLFILAVSAAQAPEAVAEVIEREKAESLIVIPGGLEEKRGTGALVARMRSALASARASHWQGPLINGGNCLGVRSLPGRYDTMFIPEFKLPVPVGRVSPLAIISQSGAFAVARMSKIGILNPKYAITLGNQMDLTVGDYLTYLQDDQEIEVFAVYVEGFARLDGVTFLDAARAITSGGRTVILYRAGRTAAGAQASASHTASIAGDYAVTRELARGAGIILADSLQEFDDLTRLFTFLRGKRADGWRLGAISNAGFECVAMADNLGRFELATFDEGTTARLQAIFRESRIDTVVDVHNPLDLTPMTGDAAYEQIVRTVMQADTVDVGIVGLVPLTVAMNTLPPGDGHREDVFREDSTAGRMVKLMGELPKAWVAVVDAGALYDPLARLLEQGGVPTFRTADSALRLLNRFCEARNRRQRAAEIGDQGSGIRDQASEGR